MYAGYQKGGLNVFGDGVETGERACRSIGIESGYLDVSNAAYGLHRDIYRLNVLIFTQ
jgi:hypothetical protein